jgi:hypothetical protein
MESEHPNPAHLFLPMTARKWKKSQDTCIVVPFLFPAQASISRKRSYFMSLTVVGSVALDTVETPSGTNEEGLGGAAVYFSLAACNFARVNLVGVVGEDFPEEHVALLEEN